MSDAKSGAIVRKPGEEDVVVRLSATQFAAWECEARYLDAEGAIRSGKSWMGAIKLVTNVIQHPGIHCLASRWSETDLDAQVKPLWRDLAAAHGLRLLWHADEQYDEVLDSKATPTGSNSRVYLRGLKSSEATSRYAKLRGLTLAFIWIDQAEELPHDVYLEAQGRLSQPGFPHQLLLTPNPPSEGHWLAAEFPEDNARPARMYIRFTLRDNLHHLGKDTVEAIEEAYPQGTAQHRRLIEGRRGLAAHGDPVYRGYFARHLHVQGVELDPTVPLLEAWDFGHAYPCVVWRQNLPWGEIRILGGVMGQGMFIGDFAPMALQFRAEWFGDVMEIRSTCDPAGEQVSSQGVPQRAVDVLAEYGVIARGAKGGNTPEKRNYAIQQYGAAMRRRTSVGEAFRINPRFMLITKVGVKRTEVLVDALEAGYVWDDRLTVGTLSPNTRRPKKDGFYDHGQNCLEYLELAFGVSKPSRVEQQKDERRLLKLAQKDSDPYDRHRLAAATAENRRGRF